MRWIAISLAAASVGCTATSSFTSSCKETWEKMKRRPNRLIVSVAPNYIEKDGFPFHQGMLVRAHFFIDDEPFTLQADGEMTFTAYDKVKNGENPTPVGLYRIAPDELVKHLRKDLVGDSYVFWLPYNPETPTQMVVNASFRPKYGEPFGSEPAIVHLTPLKQAVAEANAPEKKRPRPNYVPFDSLVPKQQQNAVATIQLRGKGPATPASSGAAPAVAAAPPAAPSPAVKPVQAPVGN